MPSNSSITLDRTAGELNVAGLWSPSFPSADLVTAAGALLTPYRVPDRTFATGEASPFTPFIEKALELGYADPRVVGSDRECVEGPRSRIVIAPGVLSVGRRDPVRAERARERVEAGKRVDADLLAQRLLLQGPVCQACEHRSCAELRMVPYVPRGRITAWSAKSRSNMVKVLASLDYAPLFEDRGLPAMVTLTYPGEWESVAPHAQACKRHLDELKRRYKRTYGAPLVGVWKREFQRRGAPHYHIHCTPPTEVVNGENFRAWLSRTWAEVVNHADPEERARHRAAGTGIDYAEGMRASDPRRLAIYFAKHGLFGAKEYQNEAPDAWLTEGGSVGRFWGVWGLEKAICTVEVTPDEAVAAARTMRRWARQNGYSSERRVWRSREGLDTGTGELTRRWSKRTVRRRVKRMRGDAGFLTLNDAPAFVSQLARYLDQVRG